MKRYLTAVVILLAVSVMAWVAFGQPEGAGRPAGAGRGFMGPEEQQKALAVIEEQVAKLKAAVQARGLPEGKSFQDLSEEEKASLKEKFAKVGEERRAAIRTILAQLARLQGRMQPPAEGEQFIIVNTADLKAIQELAVKEKAKETADRIAALMAPGRGFGGGPRPERPAGTRPGAGEKPKQP